MLVLMFQLKKIVNEVCMEKLGLLIGLDNASLFFFNENYFVLMTCDGGSMHTELEMDWPI